MRSWLLVGLLVGAACSSDDSVDRGKCTQLRDHLMDVRLQGPAVEGVDLAQHRAAMKQALGEQFVSQCEQKMSIGELRCAMKATELSGTSECARVGSASH